MSRVISASCLGILGLLVGGTIATIKAQEVTSLDTAKLRQQIVASGVNYLITKGQAVDGSFSNQTGAGVTAICTTALLRSGRTPADPAVAKALKYLEGLVQPDGGVYRDGSTHKNYETCLAIVCFKEANQGGRHDKLIKSADKFVKGQQWDESEGHDKSSFNYGGAGYGSKSRPDLSNTSFLMEALIAAGNGPDDPAVQKALIFVSRAQNLESEHNATPFAAKINDGGFYYTPANNGESFAKQPGDPPQMLRSYGSMTYAGLKSMIYAGLKKDDPRVKAAITWLRKNYTLNANPGLGDMGLYYYYHTMAKTLAALGEDERIFVDDQGNKHDWRAEMVRALAERQNEDGSWVNKNNRWLEADANLVTGYALLVLSYCK
ncbi:MAG TPA: prenyltransferase/squalene oxidase repeat-containing protein [Pirellulales bacterium]|jgi:squalene-hopene/tetraprenyl-beta-curcumene cyclase|nr:prenyltransferase/squalene oxidase repeat-containing protein [Pirellulales bacterium]